MDLLEKAHAKAAPRRFTAEPLTGFGGLDFGAVLADIREADADEAEHAPRDLQVLIAEAGE